MPPGWRARLEAALNRAWWRRGLAPLAIALLPLEAVYRLLWRWTRHRAARPEPLPVPVLVVGNLVAGGAGKTPTVIALVEALRARGRVPGLLSRGHGSHATTPRPATAASSAAEVGDEPLLLARRTGAPLWVGRDRPAAARALLAAHPEVDVLISDDGLQHRALPRQAELWLFDERGTGNGHLLPAGPLRQPVPNHLQAHQRVLYTAGHATTALPGRLGVRRLRRVWPLADWWQGNAAASVDLADWSAPARLWAAAGIAAPERFFGMLQAQGLRFHALPLPDHHRYDPAALPWPPDADAVLVTEKDAVKLPPDVAGPVPVWVLPLDFDLPAELLDDLLTLLPAPRRAAATDALE